MTRQIGTKQVLVNGELVTVRVFAAAGGENPKPSRNDERNEDTLAALRLESVYGERQ
jgi:hypothetical protein